MRESRPNKPLSRWALRILVAAAVAACAAWWWARQDTGPLASVLLADGKIYHIEKVSFGTKDRIGRHDYYSQFFHWLPVNLGGFLVPKKGESTVDLDEPALIVWVDATESTTGKGVDAQQMRLDLVDRHGDLWGERTREWSSFGNSFSRLAHIFTCFPRDEETLTLRCTPFRKKQSIQIKLKNPHLTVPGVWTGLAMPQGQAAGGLEIVLTKLNLATNDDVRYWEPSWQLLRGGLPATGWDGAEWEAEDPLGNRGQTPNVHQPVLRFSATFRPSATNLAAAVLVASLPKIDLTSTATNWWNITHHFQSNEMDALGIFPPGIYVFCNGQFTNYNPGLGPTRGGAPSGWVGMSRYVGAGRKEYFSGHYTPFPVIYLRYKQEETAGRIALRFRDDQGGCWASPETDGGSDDIHPFLLPPPTGVKMVTPEIVCLMPVQASFLVRTPVVP